MCCHTSCLLQEEEADEIEKKAAPYMMSSYYDKTALMPYAYGTYPGELIK